MAYVLCIYTRTCTHVRANVHAHVLTHISPRYLHGLRTHAATHTCITQIIARAHACTYTHIYLHTHIQHIHVRAHFKLNETALKSNKLARDTFSFLLIIKMLISFKNDSQRTCAVANHFLCLYFQPYLCIHIA